MEIIEKENEYPLWRIATSNIVDAFNSNGYGIEFAHELLKEWMGIREPETIEEVEKLKLDYLKGLEMVKSELLNTYNLYLHSIIGKGYKILTPSDQIKLGAECYFCKASRNLSKTGQVLANVDRDQLTGEDKLLQITKLNRVAFLKACFRKRKMFSDPRAKRISQ